MKPKVVYPYHYDQEWVRPVPAGGTRPQPTTRGLKELSDALSPSEDRSSTGKLVPAMKTTVHCSSFAFVVRLVVRAIASAQSPQGRAPASTGRASAALPPRGVDDAKALPLQWSVPDSKLVKWRVPVVGPRPLEPDRVGRSGLHRQRDQRHARSAAEGRPLRRHRLGARSRPSTSGSSPASTSGPASSAGSGSRRPACRSSSAIRSRRTPARRSPPTAVTSSRCSAPRASTPID